MGSVPQGMFAALKVHQHLQEESEESTPKITDKTFRSTTYSFGADTLPQRYSSKLMMSIWNLYNKYSPHNVKQHTEKLASSPSTGSLHPENEQENVQKERYDTNESENQYDKKGEPETCSEPKSEERSENETQNDERTTEQRKA